MQPGNVEYDIRYYIVFSTKELTLRIPVLHHDFEEILNKIGVM